MDWNTKDADIQAFIYAMEIAKTEKDRWLIMKTIDIIRIANEEEETD